MRAAAKASAVAKARHLLHRRLSSHKPPRLPLVSSPSLSKTLTHSPSSSSCAATLRRFSSDGISDLRDGVLLLSEKTSSIHIDGEREELRAAVSALADELLAVPDNQEIAGVLDSRSADALLRRSPNGFASIELLSRLKSRPLLALEVFNWRRKQVDAEIPMVPEEYAKAIALAGRAKNVDLAADLFSEAGAVGLLETSLYNALMTAYMYNGLIKKAVSIFEDLKGDHRCTPTIVTYNILLSIYGRSMLVDHMEAVLRTIDEAKLSRTLNTYNTVIAAYVTAWMWDQMESTFHAMDEGPIKPDVNTLLLMLRGYAHSCNLEKMERTYVLVKDQVNDRQVPVIRAMICAYCKSSHPERVQKIEALMKFMPEDEYRPWLNVLLIRVYAQEGLVEAMERFISEAFCRNTMVTTSGVMRSIISSYFQCNAVDRLAGFVKQAEYAGWRICRSLYHCKMVMYGKQNRLKEMHEVLDEMENCRYFPTKKTFLIMYKAYFTIGRRLEAQTVIGMMWKLGLGYPVDALPS
ncbi:pentatricopeptide repeat-containing protein [Cocos nucifera]|uniref:Pentatricopeptide repeat-containing protein n=1 Tax=Cocos nucifera TaxID=13894 RepID=A0A8K0I141_COCNU|nr:pentatricopeptide repeat-containing protein [Cocos nucifera]